MYDKNFLHFILNSKLLTAIFYLATSVFLRQHDFTEINVRGQVTEKLTGKIIANAEVIIRCERRMDLENNAHDTETIYTDSLGNYNINFKRGFNIEGASQASGYNPFRVYKKIEDNNIELNFALEKIKPNPSLKTLLYIECFDNNIDEDSSGYPFLRIHIPSIDTTTILDTNNITTYGFDIFTLQTNTDTTRCDFWFVPGRRDKESNVIRSHSEGGVFPVYRSDVKSSFFFEMTEAPETGYKKEIILTGEEEGLFVLGRDKKTYAKIIFCKWKIDSSGPDKKGGYEKEYGLNFSCLVQKNKTRNLMFSYPSLKLYDFIVDGQWR